MLFKLISFSIKTGWASFFNTSSRRTALDAVGTSKISFIYSLCQNSS